VAARPLKGRPVPSRSAGSTGRAVNHRSADLSLICRVEARLCALPLSHVKETLRPLPVQPVAGAPPFVQGLAVIRGAPVPVVDAARLLGPALTGAGPGQDAAAAPDAKAAPGSARFVTVAAGDRDVALAVSGVLGVRTVPAASLQALPPLLHEAAAAEAVAAIGRLDEQLLLVLRAGRLLPPGDASWTGEAR
jgi:purine-binding chemotaxis protein CheW